MICVPNFVGDDDKRLFDMQNSCYSDALVVLVRMVGKRYLYAESILRCEGSMRKEVGELRSIDHRTVQGVHDLIAAWYRFKRRTEHLFPPKGDLKGDWLSFLVDEVDSLSREPDFVTGILDACIQANTDRGHAGERRAQAVQRSRYASGIDTRSKVWKKHARVVSRA
jgi:hypothetical protein